MHEPTKEHLVYAKRLRAAALALLERADQLTQDMHADHVDEAAATLTVLSHAFAMALVRSVGEGAVKLAVGVFIARRMLDDNTATYFLLRKDGRAPWEPRKVGTEP